MADELQVLITTRDELSAKIKDAQAAVRRMTGELTTMEKHLDTTEGRKAWDRQAEAIAATNSEIKQLRSEAAKTGRAIRDYGTQGKAAADKVEDGAKKAVVANEKVRRSFLRSRGSAVLFGAGAGIAFTKAIGWAKKAASGFDTVGSQTSKLQRVMGGSAEDASRLAHALSMSGVDSGGAQKAFRAFAKQIAGGSKDFKALGINLTGAGGKARSTQAILADTADIFANMPDGAQKTALAMKLFGKAGTDMLPVLNKGKDGMAELFAESDKLGTTLSGKDLESVKAATKAKRLFGEAAKGVQVALGRELYPTLTTGANLLANRVVPLFRTAVEWIKQNRSWIGKLAIVLAVAAGVLKAVAVAQRLLNAAMAMNPVGLIVLAVVGLIAALVFAYRKVAWFRDGVNAAWGWIKRAASAFMGWFRGTAVPALAKAWTRIKEAAAKFAQWFAQVAWPAIKKVIGYVIGYYRTLWSVAKVVWKGILGAVRGYVAYFRHVAWPAIKFVVGAVAKGFQGVWAVAKAVWPRVRDAVNAVRVWFTQTALPAIKKFVEGVKTTFQTVKGAAQTAWSGVKAAVTGPIDTIKSAVQGLKDLLGNLWNGVASAAQTAADAVQSAWNGITSLVPGTQPGEQNRWMGGPVTAGWHGWVGELGPELFVPRGGTPRVIGRTGPEKMTFNQPGYVVPNHLMPAVAAAGEARASQRGPLVQIGTINASQGVDVEARVLHAMLRAERIKAERS